MFHLILNAPDGSGRARGRSRGRTLHFFNARRLPRHRLNPTSVGSFNPGALTR